MSEHTGSDDVPAVSVAVMPAEHVAVVTFANGPSNALSHELVDRLASVLGAAAENGARAAVLRTDGRHFCAGADFSRVRRSGTAGPHISEAIPRLYAQPLPLVAAVRGAVVGGGVGLALAADFRVAAPSSYVVANFTRLGINPGFGLTLTLPRLLGPQRAAALLYTGRRVDAAEALALGLFDDVVDDDAVDTVDAVALALAASVASGSPLALRATRRLLRSDLLKALPAVLERERAQQEPLFATEDFREGVQAWRDKRPPRFAGA